MVWLGWRLCDPPDVHLSWAISARSPHPGARFARPQPPEERHGCHRVRPCHPEAVGPYENERSPTAVNLGLRPVASGRLTHARLHLLSSRREHRDRLGCGQPPRGDHESPDYLKRQLITYLGNKRALLGPIDNAVQTVKDRLGRNTISASDLFTGTGVVARLLKRHCHRLIVNDLEAYARVTAACYLANRNDVDRTAIADAVRRVDVLATHHPEPGLITELYAPDDDHDVQPGERVFYTRRNAMYLDTARRAIDELPVELRPFVLAPLLARASVHVNTSGVFKGFYKDPATGRGKFGGAAGHALSRILRDITLEPPVLSRFACDTNVHQGDANAVARNLPAVDLAYLDPPYNQHPYGSNYFMLNLLVTHQRPADLSRVSGIPRNWNRSDYNRRAQALPAFRDLLENLNAAFVLVSFNSEGFISHDQMTALLKSHGHVTTVETTYNAFRGSRNLNGRPLHVTEYLYLLERT